MIANGGYGRIKTMDDAQMLLENVRKDIVEAGRYDAWNLQRTSIRISP